MIKLLLYLKNLKRTVIVGKSKMTSYGAAAAREEIFIFNDPHAYPTTSIALNTGTSRVSRSKQPKFFVYA